MGNTCNSMADSCQCMTKPTTKLRSNQPPTNKNKVKKVQCCKDSHTGFEK